MVKRKRVNAAVREQRLDIVEKLMGQGLTSAEINQVITTEWGICERQAYRYRHQVIARQSDLYGDDPSVAYAIAALKLDHQYRVANQKNDTQAAIKAVNSSIEIVKLRAKKGLRANESKPMASTLLEALSKHLSTPLPEWDAEYPQSPD
jgi:hypothetical protein